MTQRDDATPTQEDDATPEVNHGVIIPIVDEITDLTTESLRRRIKQARDKGANVLIFQMNTPGGMVSSALDITDLIKNLRDVKTVAWVNTEAHSAGSMISVACDEIVMVPSSRIGDSEVIMFGPQGAGEVPEGLKAKAFTPVLSEFRASATLNGYSQALCEAFVVPEREVWWLENIKTGEREFVFRDEKIKRMGDGNEIEPEGGDSAVKKLTRTILGLADKKQSDWKLVESYYDPILKKDAQAFQPVVRDDQLLEMSAGEAYAYGFNKAIVANEEQLQQRYALTDLVRMDTTWLENFTGWLTSIYVRGFLLVLILLGAYVEFNTPGVGVPGATALVLLAIFVGAPYLTGLANVWELVLIGVGLVLIALEIFVIPGFGVAGISGIALLLVGLLATFVPNEPGRTFPIYWPTQTGSIEAMKMGILTMACAVSTAVIGMVVMSRYLPQVEALYSIFPPNPTRDQIKPDDPYHGMVGIGEVGRCEGPLRPAGKARFGQLLADVVSEGDFIEASTLVEVIERRGNVVVVRRK